MVVAVVCGGVSGSAWLVADACWWGSRLQRLAPLWAIRFGRWGPAGLAAVDRPSVASAGALLVRPRHGCQGRLSG